MPGFGKSGMSRTQVRRSIDEGLLGIVLVKGPVPAT
jgi:hypothetical protein